MNHTLFFLSLPGPYPSIPPYSYPYIPLLLTIHPLPVLNTLLCGFGSKKKEVENVIVAWKRIVNE